jgi:hypothetical protein
MLIYSALHFHHLLQIIGTYYHGRPLMHYHG